MRDSSIVVRRGSIESFLAGSLSELVVALLGQFKNVEFAGNNIGFLLVSRFAQRSCLLFYATPDFGTFGSEIFCKMRADFFEQCE